MIIGMSKETKPAFNIISLLPIWVVVETCDGAKLTIEPSRCVAQCLDFNGGDKHEEFKLTTLRKTFKGDEELSEVMECYQSVEQIEFYNRTDDGDESMNEMPPPLDGILYLASHDVCEYMLRVWKRTDFVAPGDILGFETRHEKLNKNKPVPALRVLGLRSFK